MLELKNISLNLANSKDILNNVSLNVESGKFVVITGPNGGGKSTLAKVVAGIFKPTSGQILFDGQDITNTSITHRARIGISYAFQQPVRFKGIKVRDLITLAAGRELTTSGVCEYLSEVASAHGTMWTARSMQVFPAAKSNELRSLWLWRAGRSFPFLTSRKPESTFGVSKI